MILTILCHSRKEIHSTSVILWLFGCTRHIFWAQQSSSFCQNILSFKYWTMFQGVSIPCFSHLLICQWTLGLLPPLDDYENVAVNMGTQKFPTRPHFYQVGVSRSGISVSYSNPMLNFCFLSAKFCIPTVHRRSNFSTSFFDWATLMPFSHITMTWAAK